MVGASGFSRSRLTSMQDVDLGVLTVRAFLGNLVADKLAGLAAEAHQVDQALADGYRTATHKPK